MERLSVCVGCNKTLDKKTVKRCVQCKVACYCSAECQTKDWKEGTPRHKVTCNKGGTSLMEDLNKLIESDVTMEKVIELISKRDSQSPACIWAMKHLLMRHSDPKDRLTLKGAISPDPQKTPPQLSVDIFRLGADINPKNTPVQWMLQPALLNIVLHDNIIDANQAYLRWKVASEKLEREKAPHAEKVKVLMPLREAMTKDHAAQQYGVFIVTLLVKIARLSPEFGPFGKFAMKRFTLLTGDEESRNVLGAHLIKATQEMMMGARPQFLESGGLPCALNLFKEVKARNLVMGFLGSVSEDGWIKYGTAQTVATAFKELLVPGLLVGSFDNHFYNYSDAPDTTLGRPRRNGGTSRSSSKQGWGSEQGLGFRPFGLNVLRRIVGGYGRFRRTGGKAEESALIIAIRQLTTINNKESVGFMFFLKEKLNIPAEPKPPAESDEGEKEERGELMFEYPAVEEAFDDWLSMSLKERQTYILNTYSAEERELLGVLS